MNGMGVVFLSWRENQVHGYKVERHADDYVTPLQERLDECYAELQGYIELQDEEATNLYDTDIAELKGRCGELAWAIARFHKDQPDIGEVKMATHNRWLESVEE